MLAFSCSVLKMAGRGGRSGAPWNIVPHEKPPRPPRPVLNGVGRGTELLNTMQLLPEIGTHSLN